MSNLLYCSDVVKNYQEGNQTTNVLKGVNFSLEKNELVSIVGSSGSGKSTLLHILGALDSPTSGDVSFMGRSLTTMKSGQQARVRNRHIGFIYQFHHLLADFSAVENVAMPMLIAGKPAREARKEAVSLLDMVGLSHRIDHRPSELSGGERQRVAIARSIINRPEIVLADEPTGNLDYKTALSVYDLMRDLNQAHGTAFLIVTHDNELADKMDRKVLMQDGELV
ncbi:lipoprotein-releasing ABC transporter ATP-binding protein LolD [Vibrio salinus]|uniref:lipoprotein-releasing ABC transporter ATP-binding protein LolD n=1 Tax=Vibrio salinus TaxID=2899784 RepID=UPI001E421CDA|nr:lipoprotein-releasing ABC transporter ATP-binding protein LolD [Vibrio salinus]MCE0492857.1 lipoprotein-releasing ABC transporter ATP-binding protein LolD [Vibrio salinus]